MWATRHWRVFNSILSPIVGHLSVAHQINYSVFVTTKPTTAAVIRFAKEEKLISRNSLLLLQHLQGLPSIPLLPTWLPLDDNQMVRCARLHKSKAGLVCPGDEPFLYASSVVSAEVKIEIQRDGVSIEHCPRDNGPTGVTESGRRW